MFTLFQRLPAELRCQIWLAAMPQPRLVHLQEKLTEKWAAEEFDRDASSMFLELYEIGNGIVREAFVLELEESTEDDEELPFDWSYQICYLRTTIPALYKIDPGLQYFRQILSPEVRLLRQHNEKWQKQLERYGFTSSISRPVLPVHLLQDCSDANTVFHETRRGHLWSSCPIPALLQTCKESRQMMQLAGYELTFRTRTSASRTWFSFRHDILYLVPVRNRWEIESYGSISFDGGPWNIGQLAPSDMNRVERLALGDVFKFGHSSLLAAVRLFRNLKELLLVISDPESDEDQEHHPSRERDRWDHVELEKDLWGYLDAEAVDVYTNCPRSYNNEWVLHDSLDFLVRICSNEKKMRRYRHFQRREDWGFWPQLTGDIEEWLQRQKEGTQANGGMEWSVPKVRIVHAVTRAQAREIMSNRFLHSSILWEAENDGKLFEAGERSRRP